MLSTPCQVKPREWKHKNAHAHAGITPTFAEAQTRSAPELVINATSASVLAAQQHRQMPAATLSQPQTDAAPALPAQTAAGVSSPQAVTTEAVASQHEPRQRQSSEQRAAAPVQQNGAVQPNLPSATVSPAASAAPVAALSAALAGGAQTEPPATSSALPSVARPTLPAPTMMGPPSIAPVPVTTTGVSSAAVSPAALSAASPAAPPAAHSPASAAAAPVAPMTNQTTIALASVPIAAQMATPVHQSAAAECKPAQALHSSASSAAAAASGYADLSKVSQQTPEQMPVASDAHTVAQTVTSAGQATVTGGGALPSAYANLTGRLKPSVSMSMRPRSVAMGSKAKIPLKSGKLPTERPDLPFEPASLPFGQPLSAAQPSGAVASAGGVAGHALQQSLSASVMPQMPLASGPVVTAPTLVAAAAAAHPASGVEETSILALQDVPDAATASKGRTEGASTLLMDRPEGSPAAAMGTTEGVTAEPMGRPASVPIGGADGSGAMSMGSRGMPGRQESRKGALPASSRARVDKQSSGVAAASAVPRTSSRDRGRDRDRHTSQDRHQDR